ncbi:MAG: trehalose-phosphatase [Pseudomonadota bacterium]
MSRTTLTLTPEQLGSSGDWPLPPLSTASLFLDFDGTLVDLAPRPDGIKVPKSLAQLLQALDHRLAGRLAIVSGRAIADLAALIGFYQGIIVGGHGAEILRDGKVEPLTAIDQPALTGITQELMHFADTHPGVLCEAKATGVVLHYRNRPEAEAQIRERLTLSIKSLPGFVLHDAKMAVEIKPSDASKGDAVARLMAEFDTAIPVAMGDDTTDEDMFRVALAAGGTAVKVGDGDTAAPLRCINPAHVHDLLSGWLAQP